MTASGVPSGQFIALLCRGHPTDFYAPLDGLYVLRTNTKLTALQAMLRDYQSDDRLREARQGNRQTVEEPHSRVRSARQPVGLSALDSLRKRAGYNARK
jgi:hypothetical protein